VIGRQPYRKRKSITLPVAIIVLAIFLSFSSLWNLFGVRSLFSAIIYPFQYVTVSVWKGIVGTPGAIINITSLSNENSKIKATNDLLRAKGLSMRALVEENERLRKDLGFKNASRYRYRLLPAQVTGKAPTPWFSILQINRGSNEGVKKNKAVVVKEGLIGRVIEVNPFSSKVMLITDVESSVAATDSRSRDFGIVKGVSRNRLAMRYVSAGKDIRIGDKIVTSQISTVFPPGIPIGIISQAAKREHDLFYYIEIKPAVDFSKIEEVFVIL
jgi:rod shape-determining protein MreC